MTASAERGRCIKCGREIDLGESLCPICNRAGMTTPSASQYHGTVAAAIVLAVIGLAVAASLSLRGVGPYAAEVRAVTPAEPVGYAITYAVTNEGTRPGRAKCQLIALGAFRRAAADPIDAHRPHRRWGDHRADRDDPRPRRRAGRGDGQLLLSELSARG